MAGRSAGKLQRIDPAAGKRPPKLDDVSLAERWAPLVDDPERRTVPLPRSGRRLAAAAICMAGLALLLLALTN